MAFAGVFALGACSGDRDSSASSVQSGTRRSSRKAKPTRSFFDLQSSTLWSQKRRAATALESGAAEQQPAEKICVREAGCDNDKQMDKQPKEHSETKKRKTQQEDHQVRHEKEAAQKQPRESADSANERLREQQSWLIEGIKSDAIKAFAKIVENRLIFSQPATTSATTSTTTSATTSATNPVETAAQLTQRLELMSRQHEVEITRLNMLQQLQVAELQHNHMVAMCEQRAALDLEKQAALTETLRGSEAELARRIDAVKARQWCATCGREAFFYCCWNTAYCDSSCQQRHWPTHMTVCAQRGQHSAMR